MKTTNLSKNEKLPSFSDNKLNVMAIAGIAAVEATVGVKLDP